ncbi:IS3 family transposase [Streptosporangium sp. NPDC001681]|uniref:IS3 family transposase n=1 Tax=Streptosporangium sp. NPDC001681 TaxID=3154395 RepID=UPI00332C70DC
MTRPSKFGDEFKRDAVRLVRTTGRTCADVAWELGMNRETLRTWVREAESEDGESGVGLATVIDIGSRRLIGWSIAGHLRTELISDALTAAVRARGGHTTGVIFHADRGCQYTSAGFAALCAANGIRRSSGRAGTCLDNALAEAFNATLKRELLHGKGKRRWSDEAEAHTEIFRWIARYNHRRRHSAIGNLPPAVYEDRLAGMTALAA